MRRRRTTASDGASAEAADPIDENEQDEIVKNINDDASAQMKEMIQIFGYICLVAAVACVVLGVTASTKVLGVHAMVASGLHILARYLCSSTSATSFWRDAGLLVATVFPMLALFLLLPAMSLSNYGAESEYHLSLTLGNLLTSVTCVFLKRDQNSTAKAISELHASKYSFKSL
jgi:hypothetical protein